MPMKIITRDFGEQEIEEDKIITFPEGIIGFENVKRYALLSPLGDGGTLLRGLRPDGDIQRLSLRNIR